MSRTTSAVAGQQDFLTKLNLVLIPFCLAQAGFLLAYSLLHVISVRVIGLPLESGLLEIWFPLFLAFVIAVAFMQRRFTVLDLDTPPKRDGQLFYNLFAALLLAAPTIVIQPYIGARSFGLSQLDHVESLHQAAPNRFYQLPPIELDTVGTGQGFISGTNMSRGKNSANLSAYFAVPVQDSLRPRQTCPEIWIFASYRKQVGRSQGPGTAEYEEFWTESGADFRQEDFRTALFFEDLPPSFDRDFITKEIAKHFQVNPEKHLFLLAAHHETFAQRGSHVLKWFWIVLGMGLAIFAGMALVPKLDAEGLQAYRQKRIPDNYQDIGAIARWFIPRGDHFATSLLCSILILFFFIQLFFGKQGFWAPDAVRLQWGAATDAFVFGQGQYWRLLTSAILSLGIIPLGVGSFALFLIGKSLEPSLKAWWMLVAYLLTSIAGNCVGMWYDVHFFGADSSIGIFGLQGLLAMLIVMRVIPKPKEEAYQAGTVIVPLVLLLIPFWGKEAFPPLISVLGLLALPWASCTKSSFSGRISAREVFC